MIDIYLSTSFVLGTLGSLGASALNNAEKVSFLWEADGLSVLDVPVWKLCWRGGPAGQGVGWNKEEEWLRKWG